MKPRVGDIYRIRARQDNGIGPVFIRVVKVPRGNAIHVIDYMDDGQLAGECHNPWGGMRPFQLSALKHWRLAAPESSPGKAK